MLQANSIALSSIEPELLLTEILGCGNGDFLFYIKAFESYRITYIYNTQRRMYRVTDATEITTKLLCGSNKIGSSQKQQLNRLAHAKLPPSNIFSMFMHMIRNKN